MSKNAILSVVIGSSVMILMSFAGSWATGIHPLGVYTILVSILVYGFMAFDYWGKVPR